MLGAHEKRDGTGPSLVAIAGGRAAPEDHRL